MADKKRVTEILSIEDNEADRNLMQQFFATVCPNCNLTFVNNGEEAMQYLKHEGKYEKRPIPQLILCDWNMPKKGGSEVLTEIKRDPVLKHIPVIMLSSSCSTKDVRDAYALHANCYLVKPLFLDEFEALLLQLNHFWIETVQLDRTVEAA